MNPESFSDDIFLCNIHVAFNTHICFIVKKMLKRREGALSISKELQSNDSRLPEPLLTHLTRLIGADYWAYK